MYLSSIVNLVFSLLKNYILLFALPKLKCSFSFPSMNHKFYTTEIFIVYNLQDATIFPFKHCSCCFPFNLARNRKVPLVYDNVSFCSYIPN